MQRSKSLHIPHDGPAVGIAVHFRTSAPYCRQGAILKQKGHNRSSGSTEPRQFRKQTEELLAQVLNAMSAAKLLPLKSAILKQKQNRKTKHTDT